MDIPQRFKQEGSKNDRIPLIEEEESRADEIFTMKKIKENSRCAKSE
jgi:hypothetical protein